MFPWFCRHMRFTALSTRRSQQSGQAIVLIALTLLVLFGMLGLAIDGGRAYIDRRELQNAVDAAVLGGGDQYQRLSDSNVPAHHAATHHCLYAPIPTPGS